MGISVRLFALDPEVLNKVIQDPRLVNYLTWHPMDLQMREENEPDNPDIVRPPSTWLRAGMVRDEHELHMDRGWFILETVLTGVDAGGPPPLGNVVWGARPLEAFSGEVAYLTGQDVKELAAALEPITEADVAAKFAAHFAPGDRHFSSDHVRMDRLSDAMGALRNLRTFYVRAAAQGRGILKRFS